MTTTHETPTTGGALTEDELKADLTLDQLRQLVGLVEYDASSDPFPVTAMDAICFVVGNATQTATFYQLAFGMELEAYRGPENGLRDAKVYVLRSGSARFVFAGGVTPDSPLLEHHRKHGDGVVDLALEVPDVDRCIDHARSVGATILDEPYDISDEHGTVRMAAIATYGETRHSAGRPVALRRPLPARLRGALDRGDPPRGAPASGSSRPSTTASATSSSAGWTSGWTSTTRSWASRTWPSSSVTTSPPTTPR